MASVQEIFLRALEVPPAERPILLDEACQGDADLRQEVESLLKHHQPNTLLGTSLPTIDRTANTSRTQIKGAMSVAANFFTRERPPALSWAAAAIVIVTTGYFTHKKVQEFSENQARQQLQAVLDSEAIAVQLWVDGRIKQVNTCAEDPAVRAQAEKLIDEVGDDAERSRALDNSPKLTAFNALLDPCIKGPNRPQILLLNREGLRIGREGRHNNERAAAFITTVLEGRTRFAPPSRLDAWAAGRPVAPQMVNFAMAPLRDSSGEIFGLLTLVHSGDAGLESILKAARIGETGESYAISPDGMMLSSSRFNKILRDIGLISKEPKASAALNLQVRDPGGDLAKGYKSAMDRSVLPLTLIARVATASRQNPPSQQTGTILSPYRDYRGREVVGAWKWLPEHDFGIITEVDAAEAFAAPRYVSRAFYTLFGSLGIFGALTLVSSIARRREPQIGQYILSKQIGEGGTSKVYLAHHIRLKRPTAVKILTPSDKLPRETIQRFEREVRAASRLAHPNTIRIFDFGRTPDGSFYCVMEYLPGLTLAELVSLEGRLPEGRVVMIMKQICASLREAHALGLIHRDIKPQNIMLYNRGGEYDFVKVLDFGLVWNPNDPDTRITNSQNITGTPLYMAPERIGKPLEADARSDIYSLGALAYYLLSGRPIFPNVTGFELLGQIMHGVPDPLSELVPSLSPEMASLVMNSISRDVTERPPSVVAILQILNALPNTAPWTQDMAESWWTRRAPPSKAQDLVLGARRS